VPVFDLIVDKGKAEFEVSRYSVAISPRHKMAIKEATISLLSGEFKWRGSRRTKTQDHLVILRVKGCPHCAQPFGMYKIETSKTRCGVRSAEELVNLDTLLQSHVTEAVGTFVEQHPDLDFTISYPYHGPCPRSRIVDTYFICSNCMQLISIDRYRQHWERNSEIVATISLGKVRVNLSREPHWCYSPEKDFCC
jgi:hypothetical protein